MPAAPMVFGRPALSDLDLTRYVNFSDDFHGFSSEPGEIGQMGWSVHQQGDNGSIQGNLYGQSNGIITLRANSAVDWASFSLYEDKEMAFPSEFAIGSTMRVRWYMRQITECAFWAGLTNNKSNLPLLSGAVGFLGFRFDPAVSANVQFVVKDGADADNEDTVSIVAGVAQAMTTYEVTRVATDAYRVSSGGAVKGTLSGVTNDPPAANMEHTIGAYGTAAAGATINLTVDFYQAFSPLDRR